MEIRLQIPQMEEEQFAYSSDFRTARGGRDASQEEA